MHWAAFLPLNALKLPYQFHRPIDGIKFMEYGVRLRKKQIPLIVYHISNLGGFPTILPCPNKAVSIRRTGYLSRALTKSVNLLGSYPFQLITLDSTVARTGDYRC